MESRLSNYFYAVDPDGPLIIADPKSEHKAIVERYLLVTEFLRALATGDEGIHFSDDETHRKEDREQAARLEWALLRSAHIIELSTKFGAVLQDYVGRQTYHLIGKPDTDEDRALTEQECEQLRTMPMPTEWPFERCWLAWGRGLPTYRINRSRNTREDLVWMGTLISPHFVQSWFYYPAHVGKTVHEWLALDQGLPKSGEFQAIAHWTSTGGWLNTMFGMPLVVDFLASALKDASTVVKRGPKLTSDRLAFGKRVKSAGVLGGCPPPYYQVTMEAKYIEERIHKVPTRKRASPDYRFDVEEHSVHRLASGRMDDARLIQALMRRGYRIFVAGQKLDEDASHYLIRKHIQLPRLGEFIAVQTIRRHAYVKGPEGAPYIPSTRKLRG